MSFSDSYGSYSCMKKKKGEKIMTKKIGFTLAEVLITLGIIGVVAAMTIPTLIANTNSAKFRSQFKKSLSTLNQAALMGQAQYDMNYGDATKTCGAAATGITADAEDPDSHPTICAILNKVLSGRTYVADPSKLANKKGAYTITGAGTTTGSGAVSGNYFSLAASTDATALAGYHAYTLADGSLFAFQSTSANCTSSSPCYGFIDVNGSTLPNKEVNCDTGTDTAEKPCTVENDAAHMTDVFPVRFYDSTVEPATNAARYILTTSK